MNTVGGGVYIIHIIYYNIVTSTGHKLQWEICPQRSGSKLAGCRMKATILLATVLISLLCGPSAQNGRRQGQWTRENEVEGEDKLCWCTQA